MLLGLVILFVSSVNSSPIPQNGLILETERGNFYLPPGQAGSEYVQNQGQTLPEVDPDYPHISVRLTEDDDKVEMDNDGEGEVKPAQTGPSQVFDSKEEYQVDGEDADGEGIEKYTNSEASNEDVTENDINTQTGQEDNDEEQGDEEVDEEVTEDNTNNEGSNKEVSDDDTYTQILLDEDITTESPFVGEVAEEDANIDVSKEELTEKYTEQGDVGEERDGEGDKEHTYEEQGDGEGDEERTYNEGGEGGGEEDKEHTYQEQGDGEGDEERTYNEGGEGGGEVKPTQTGP